MSSQKNNKINDTIKNDSKYDIHDIDTYDDCEQLANI